MLYKIFAASKIGAETILSLSLSPPTNFYFDFRISKSHLDTSHVYYPGASLHSNFNLQHFTTTDHDVRRQPFVTNELYCRVDCPKRVLFFPYSIDNLRFALYPLAGGAILTATRVLLSMFPLRHSCNLETRFLLVRTNVTYG